MVTFSNHNSIIGETTTKIAQNPINTLFGHKACEPKVMSNVKIENKNTTLIILVGMDLGTNSPELLLIYFGQVFLLECYQCLSATASMGTNNTRFYMEKNTTQRHYY